MKFFFQLIILPFSAFSLPAAVIHTRLPQPFDANARAPEGELGYERLPIDFNSDGTPELVVTVTSSEVNILHTSLSRVFILSSPPPNIGGSAASILGGVEINGDIENPNFRWYNGQTAPSAAFPGEIPERITAIGITLTTGSIGHTRGFDGYLGFEFGLEDGLHYAWIHLDASGNARDSEGRFIGVGGFIDGWAWETTPGMGIIAGAVPEPSAALLAILTMGGCLLRRHRAMEP